MFLRVMSRASGPLTWAAAAAGCRHTTISGRGKLPWLRCRQGRCRFCWLDAVVWLPVLLRSGWPEEAEERCEPRPQRTLQRSSIMHKPITARPANHGTPSVTCM